ncbi:MAG: 1-deoxy-D-xylulose-5-phosphate synthase [Candidatus Tectomicrobia bacterium]|nr:1-deoxy-D-xylulose-5-phosphate synthase [Candidatus Tectomicrobia bacterium]
MGEILNRIDGPEDLRRLTLPELEKLAAEAREEIVRVITTITGGHLGANLGSVELTLALHYVFNTPEDQVVWDVGHQVYTHKLITGRRNRFETIRQYNGLYGFTRRGESPYDLFTTAHAGTAISTSLGLVEARDKLGKTHKIIAVVGDGALTAGIALEGLNNGGALGKDFLLILNDNKMSIAPNVGAFSTYLSRIMTGQLFVRLRKEFLKLLKQIPGIGSTAVRLARKLEGVAKSLISPGIVFEELGYKYVGPINGHNLGALIQTFENIKAFSEPVLLHVLTEKGKGYPPAEENRVKYHGVSPKKPEPAANKVSKKDAGAAKAANAPKAASPPSYTGVFADTLIRLAREDDRNIGITAAMPDGTGLDKFQQAFPDRFYDVGIAEQHGVAFSAGLASAGMRPVAAIYSTFLQRAYDQIFHDVCLQNLPVTFALDRGGVVGEDGPTHHGVFDLTYLRAFPHMVIMAPMDENELQHMLKTAIEHLGPAAVRYPRGSGEGVPMDEELRLLEIGKGQVLREGDDLAFLAIGNTVHPALKAAEALSLEGIEAAVVNMRFAKPVDAGLIERMARDAHRLVTLEDNTLYGGFGSAVLECLADRGLLRDTRVLRLGIPDAFVPHGALKILRKLVGLDAESIAESARSFLHNAQFTRDQPDLARMALDGEKAAAR